MNGCKRGLCEKVDGVAEIGAKVNISLVSSSSTPHQQKVAEVSRQSKYITSEESGDSNGGKVGHNTGDEAHQVKSLVVAQHLL